MIASSSFFQRVRTLVRKEFQGLLGDPVTRRILIAPVILQCLLFPFAASLEVKNATLAVLNQDTGAASTELIQRFAAAGAFTHLLNLQNENQLRVCIERQQALVALQFPADFSRAMVNGQPASVQAILDGRRSNSGQIAFGYLQEIFQQYLTERNLAVGKTDPSTLIVRHWFNPNLEYRWSLVPSLIATITTLGTLIVTSMSLTREKEIGTFEQLLVSPLTPEMIMLGKALPALCVGLVQGTIVLLAAVLAYRIPFEGHLIYLYVAMIFYILALIGIGLLISSISATQQQAFLAVFSFVMPAILLSGFTSPIDNMPPWMQWLTLLNPLRHFMRIVKSIFLKDVPLDFVLQSTVPLLLIALLTISLAVWMFRRKTA